MLAYTYKEPGKFILEEKEKPVLQEPQDAIVRVTMASICSSDLHIRHGAVPRAVPGITVGHEMVGIVESVGVDVNSVSPGDRVTVNVETFCGTCYFCQHGYVNNCADANGGWALGCRIDGGQAEYVRVPYADQGLNKIPDGISDEAALFVGDVLATGYWAAEISEITEEDTVLIIGGGPTGICTLLCVRLKKPKRILVSEVDPVRIRFLREHYPDVTVINPKEIDVERFVKAHSDHGGADRVLEAAGGKDTFELAWKSARPNAIVTIVALYEDSQTLPLPQMYGKNLTFKTGGVDGCSCEETLRLIAEGKLDTTPLITHTFPLKEIDKAYDVFEHHRDGVMKIAVTMDRTECRRIPQEEHEAGQNGERSHSKCCTIHQEEYEAGQEGKWDRFEFRDIRPEEAEEAARIEQICFPPNEACSEPVMRARIARAPELFLVAPDRETGRIAGFLNGLATGESSLRDEFFQDVDLHDPKGRNIMILGLDVLPEYRRQGLASEMMRRYLRREKENGRETIILTCLEGKVSMYEKMGFYNRGISGSSWGGEQWYEMACCLSPHTPESRSHASNSKCLRLTSGQ